MRSSRRRLLDRLLPPAVGGAAVRASRPARRRRRAGDGALLLATVAGELVTPRFVARVGYRWALALGLILLGAPDAGADVLPAPVILAVSAGPRRRLRVCVWPAAPLTAALIPAERRGEGLALVGLVGGVPGLLALPAGVWAAARWGYAPCSC